MNGTIIGILGVLIWGASLPIARMLEELIGIPALIGSVFAGAGILGLSNHILRGKPFPGKGIFRNPFLYGRWLFFVLHEALNLSAIMLVSRANVPFVILINYIWPTAVIFCSVFFAGVKITKWWALLLGTAIVLVSLATEILGPKGISKDLFENPTDQLGYAMSFAGAISWGLYCAFTKRAGDSTGGGSVVPLFQLTLGIALPISFLPNYATWDNLTGWWPLFLFGFCIMQFIAYLSWDYGMRLGNIIILSLCADFIPWLSILACHFLLGVKIEAKTIAAVIFLVLGAMIARYGTMQRISKPQQLKELYNLD